MKVGLEMKEMDLLQVQSYLKDDDGFLSKKHAGFTNLFVSMALKRLQVDSEVNSVPAAKEEVNNESD